VHVDAYRTDDNCTPFCWILRNYNLREAGMLSGVHMIDMICFPMISSMDGVGLPKFSSIQDLYLDVILRELYIPPFLVDQGSTAYEFEACNSCQLHMQLKNVHTSHVATPSNA
jgi:hypothetical protein